MSTKTKYPIKTCPACGLVFPHVSGFKFGSYCSTRCRARGTKDRVNPWLNKPCARCGVVYPVRILDIYRKYCSNKCRDRRPNIYNVWAAMKSRCNNPKNKSYEGYGERGIKVCDAWNKFRNFENDMSPTYKQGLAIERIDNDSGYCKDNCRWATPAEQANNKRCNIKIEFQGESRGLSEWSRLRGIPVSTLRSRVRSKWPVERIFNY